MHRVQMSDLVRVSINHNVATELPSAAQVNIAQVKLVRIRIVLHRHTNACRSLQHGR